MTRPHVPRQVAAFSDYLLFRRAETLLRLDLSHNKLTRFGLEYHQSLRIALYFPTHYHTSAHHIFKIPPHPLRIATALPNLRMLYLHGNAIPNSDPEPDPENERPGHPVGAVVQLRHLEKLSLHNNPMCFTKLASGAVLKRKEYRVQVNPGDPRGRITIYVERS